MRNLKILFLLILTTVCKVKAIAGGHPGQSPHQVFIKGLEGWRTRCSGTIISDRLILTAAWCVDDTIPDKLTVVAGVTDVNSDKALVFRITKITQHPDYVCCSDYEHDLAVLETLHRIPVEEDDRVEAALLPDNNEVGVSLAGTMIHVGGWGRVSSSSNYHNHRDHQVIEIPIRSDRDCSDEHNGWLQTYYYPASMFCAGSPGTAPCGGDYGAGAIRQRDGEAPRILGTFVSLSWNRDCDGPGLFTMDILWLQSRYES